MAGTSGERTGSGTIVWKSRERLSSGEIDYDQFMDIVASSAPSVGYCNTMGTATTMNSLAEALGMQLPGSAAIPAPYRERGQISYETGKRIVDMVWEDLKPSDIMTREAFENAIVVNSAIGGSTNAPIHLNAIARHLDIPLDNDDWQTIGHDVPLMVNLQPAGEYLGEDYHHAGGVPAVVAELMKADLLPYPDARTVNGKCIGDELRERGKFRRRRDPALRRAAERQGRVHQSERQPLRQRDHEDQRDLRGVPPALSVQPGRSRGFRRQGEVFDGPEDYHTASTIRSLARRE